MVDCNYILESEMPPVLDGVVFPWEAQICSLGVLLDPALLLYIQVMGVARDALYHHETDMPAA